jgi:pimeloyl-ACP methyl ester carboxylesterase
VSLVSLIAVTAVALAAAAPPQTSASDRLVDAGGVTLHMQCDGARAAGHPVVVLEAGAGNSAKTWRDVFAPIAQFARVCAYDRQGLGTSGRTAAPQSGVEAVETLHALLQAAGEQPPYVLAGHSYGGMLVRLYATRYPSEVAGLVLVDSSHEEQLTRFGALTPPPPTLVPQPVSPEQIDLAGTSRELARAPWRATIPLVVLSRGLWFKTPPATPDPQADARLAIWQELHRELATRSPQAELQVAAHSGHYIQNDEPSLVIEAIRRVVAKTTQ